jgi:hypothetical protein
VNAFTFLRTNLGLSGADLRRFGQAVKNIAMVAGAALLLLGKAWRTVFTGIIFPVVRRVIPGVVQIVRGGLRVIGGLIKFWSSVLTLDFKGMWQGIRQVFSGQLKVIGGVIRAATAPFRAAIAALGRGMKGAFSAVFNGIRDAFRGVLNWLIDKWNGLELKIDPGKIAVPLGPDVDIPGVTIGTPNIPKLGMGGIVAAGGAAVVGELGPELLRLPRGARVDPLPHQIAAAAIKGDGDVHWQPVVVKVGEQVLLESVARGVRNREARK